MLCMITNIIND